MTRDEKQQEFNWTFLQRREWIREAQIGPGVGNSGRGVSEKTMKSVLHILNEHYGSNQCSWPSIEKIASESEISSRQVITAIQALQEKNLLIVLERERAFGNSYNEYRIVWTELQLLEASRRDQWLRMLKGATEQSDMTREQGDMVTEQGDMVTEQGDMVTEQGDMVTEQGDMVSPEQTTNNSQNKPKNNSPLHDSWEVVVSDLFSRGMKAARRAVSEAQRRELTPRDVFGLIERWERLRARQPDQVTIGWLYRWIIGASDPSDSEPRPTAPRPSTTSVVTRYECERAKIWKAGRAAGVPEKQILRRVSEVLGEPPVNERTTELARQELMRRLESCSAS